MKPVEKHNCTPDVSFDGGDLDCGNGLLLLIRKHIDPMNPGELLEIRSTEISVDEDLPAWCRLTGNELVSWTKSGKQRSSWYARASLKSGPGRKRHPPAWRRSGLRRRKGQSSSRGGQTRYRRPIFPPWP